MFDTNKKTVKKFWMKMIIIFAQKNHENTPLDSPQKG